MNTPERRTDRKEPELDWKTRKAPRHIPQDVIETVRRRLNFVGSEKVTSIR